MTKKDKDLIKKIGIELFEVLQKYDYAHGRVALELLLDSAKHLEAHILNASKPAELTRQKTIQ